jgi:prepilin-type processing-associated H-X9-DG protein
LLPSLARAKAKALGISCLNNTKQSTLAWIMYSGDNGETLAPNPGSVGGSMSWLTGAAGSDNTNADIVLNPTTSALAPYLKSSTIFKCPADKYQASGSPGPRIRSLSMNGALSGGSGSGPTVKGTSPGGRTYYGAGTGGPARKSSDLVTPGPSLIFVWLDEHADSINDATFMLDPGYDQGQERWRDLPASYHNGAGSFSFADGHSEIHKWQDARTLLPVIYLDWSSQPQHGVNLIVSKDYEWLDDRMPYH